MLSSTTIRTQKRSLTWTHPKFIELFLEVFLGAFRGDNKILNQILIIQIIIQILLRNFQLINEVFRLLILSQIVHLKSFGEQLTREHSCLVQLFDIVIFLLEILTLLEGLMKIFFVAIPGEFRKWLHVVGVELFNSLRVLLCQLLLAELFSCFGFFLAVF